MNYEEFQVNEAISSLDVSRDFLVSGTLDERIYVWKNPNPSSQLYAKIDGNLMGVVDIKIDENETKVAASCFDSMIRIWDLDDTTKCTKIRCNVFENWKVRFLDNYTIITGGEGGLICYYNIETKGRIGQTETDKVYFITSIETQSNDYGSSIICAGNDGGYLYTITQQKINSKIKPHGKAIKALAFVGENKILTGSDDGLIKLIDLEKYVEESYFAGHKYGVNGLDLNPIDSNTFASSAIDRTTRIWSLNQKNSVRVIPLGQDKPEVTNGVKYTKDGKYLCAAHQCGFISFYK